MSLFCNTLGANFLVDRSFRNGGGGQEMREERPLKYLAEGPCSLRPGSWSEEPEQDPGRQVAPLFLPVKLV